MSSARRSGDGFRVRRVDAVQRMRTLEKLGARGLHLSASDRLKFSRIYDARARESVQEFEHIVRVGEWEGPRVWSSRSNVTRPNFFFWSYWAGHGEIDVPWLQECKQAITFGGSAWDGLVGLKLFDHADRKVRIGNQEFLDYCSFMGFEEDMAVPLHPHEYRNEILVKMDANPGPTFIKAGIRKKAEAVGVAMTWLLDVLEGQMEVSDVPGVLWGMGGRGKPQTMEKVLEKSEAVTVAGRAVWMADTHESVFAWRYVQPLTELLTLLKGKIDIGYNKNDPEQIARMRDELSVLGYQVSGDWEAFDASVPSDLIRFAFRVIRRLLGIRKGSIDARLLGFLERNFIESYVVCPDGYVYLSTVGVPSGSGFTALVDSIVNSFVIWRISKVWEKRTGGEKGRLTSLRVCGDDNLQVFSFPSSVVGYRWKMGKEYIEFAREYAKRNFGMSLHVEKTRLSVDPFVKFVIPKIYERVPDHSQRYLRKNPPLVYAGGYLERAEGIRAYRIRRDPSAVEVAMEMGARRWNYLFSGTVMYLSTHYLSSGLPIRPKPDAMSRLGSTAAPVDNVFQWRALLMQYLLEHRNNIHARDELVSMWLDSFYMERAGIYDWGDAARDVELVLSDMRRYPVRDYVLSHLGGRVADPGHRGRQWWQACANWRPNLRDRRFLWLSDHIRALHEVLGRAESRTGLGHDELGRLRPVLLFTKKGQGYAPGRRLLKTVGGFLAAWCRAAGAPLEWGGRTKRIVWDPGTKERATAKFMRCGYREDIASGPRTAAWPSLESLWSSVDFLYPLESAGWATSVIPVPMI